MAPVRDIVFLGASTAFKEISEVIRDLNRVEERYRVVALLDDNEALHGTSIDGVPVAGPLAAIDRYPDAGIVFGIGSFRTRMIRRRILEQLAQPEERYLTLVHPAAKVYPDASIGAGSIIHLGTVIANDARIDPWSIVTFNAVVGPHCHIGTCAMVTTAVVLLARVQVGSCAFIGALSCVAEGVRIGPGAMVGMGTHVYRDVRPGAYILGSPPRELSRDEVPPELLSGW